MADGILFSLCVTMIICALVVMTMIAFHASPVAGGILLCVEIIGLGIAGIAGLLNQ